MTIRLTLIVPSYQGEEHIEPCLRSILEQTMDRSSFEILVVVNGAVDSVPTIVHRMFEGEHDINYRVLFDDFASLSNARNLGIREAKGEWVTWVDVDDWLSPNFLEELFEAAAEGVTPLAKVIDIEEDSGAERSSPITDQILSLEAGVHPPATIWRALGFAVCKLLPTAAAKRKEFDTELRSGEDVAYFPPFYSENKLQLDNTPAHHGATYFRQVRAGSMSRQNASFDFNVNQRLAVMKHLDEGASHADGEMKSLMHSMMRSQTLFAARYISEYPDALESVIDAFSQAGLSYCPWHMLASKSDRLAISYNFVPYADASAVVAAKRIMHTGRQWNVISNDMSTVRSLDEKLNQRVMPYISQHRTVRNPAVFGNWRGVQQFCDDGMEYIDEIERIQGPQTEMYSRSMWPASHYLAALHKLRSPMCTWTAEFSDPLRKDVLGNDRSGAILNDQIWAKIDSGVRSAGYRLEVGDSLFENCEKVAYALADHIFFTNAHQMAYMLSYLEDEDLKERVRSVAVVKPQPSPNFHLYGRSSSDIRPEPKDHVDIGYFGSFHANRGAGVLLPALVELPVEVRANLKLHLYTIRNEQLEQEIARNKLEQTVLFHSPLPYLEFLTAAASMDYLLITDTDSASSGHRINPYLPSKLSDYRATGRPIWALYEPGSTLSRSNLDIMNKISEPDQIRTTLAGLGSK